MVVYVEDLFAEGFLIFFLSSFLSFKTVRQKAFWKSLLFGFMGGALYLLLPKLNFAYLGGVILTVFIVLLWVLLVSKTNCLLMFFITLITLIFVIGSKKVITENFGSNVFVLTIIFLSIILIFCKLIKHFFKVKKQCKFEYKVHIEYGKNVYVCKAFLDSGNSLEDTSGLPIMIIDYNTFLHITGLNFLDIANNNNLPKTWHSLTYKTIGEAGKLFVFEADKVFVDGQEKKCLLGVSLKSNFGQYSALLNIEMFA